MTGVKIQIRKTPTYLKCLAETRARVDADVRRLQKIHDEIAEKLTEAKTERDSCDCLIRKYDERLDPNVITPIQAWKGRYGPRGALKRFMLKQLENAWPEAVTTLEIAWAVQQEFKMDFPRFCRHISTSSLKLLECPRAQLVEVTVPADSIVKPLDVFKHI